MRCRTQVAPDGRNGRLLLRSKTNVEKGLGPSASATASWTATAVFEDGTTFDVKKAEWRGSRRIGNLTTCWRVAKELREREEPRNFKLARARKLLEDELASGPRRAAYLKNRASERGHLGGELE